MKKALLILSLSLPLLALSQTWNTNGNAETNPSSDFIGTTDDQNLIFKTNNVERLKIGQGQVIFTVGKNENDGIDIVDNATNRNAGTDIVWIKSRNKQVNDIGVLTLSTSILTNPIFSARENGKVFMGVALSNYNLSNCSDCSDYRLFVKNGIKTEKIKVEVSSTNGWADFVFKKDYQLPTLEEVELHITEKGHLPNIPPAEEVVKNGINLGEMDAKLLQKIEELTLYTIEQNKLNKEQSEAIQKLQTENKEQLDMILLLREEFKKFKK